MPPTTKFNNSYLLTNRYYPAEQLSSYIYPLPPGQLYFYMAPGQYNYNYNAYKPVNASPTKVVPATFAQQIEKDLKIAIANGCPQITVYVHGLANYLSDTCNELGLYGANLQKQGYNGLVIAFDWPSYGDYESWYNYGSLPYSFPPTATSGTIRDNINGSIQSFITMLSLLSGICRKYNAKLNFMCHSEGNYMLMLAMNYVTFTPTAFMNQVLLLGADINVGALQTRGKSPWSGQLAVLNPYAVATTVYWSSHDDALPSSEGWTNYHNPQYPKRLGLHGPSSFGSRAMIPIAYGLDCSLVVNRTVMNKTGVPSSVSVHSSYFYIPQVLQDMAQTLNGVPPAKVTNRVSARQPNGRAFTMKLKSSLLTGPFVPSGKRLETLKPKARRANTRAGKKKGGDKG
ncbi:MAG: hypothetical protein QOH63_3510 [Acidobacteriota bacterium]|jgi:hypothetical protein|nr:hypothetical protein [Acidobacteriota bacterium]